MMSPEGWSEPPPTPPGYNFLVKKSRRNALSGFPWALLLLAFSTLALGAVHVARGQVKQYPSRVSRNAGTDPWKRESVDTAADVNYMTDSEKQVIAEVNMVRTNPGEYARRYLVPLRTLYSGRLLRYPGQVPILTEEGVRALDECIEALQGMAPEAPLSPKKGLALAARDHVNDQSRTGATGHIGSDGSEPQARISRYGRWSDSAGEDIDYGNADARRIVISLLVDDGVRGRGHRLVLFTRSFRFAGVAIGTHKAFRHMCVIDFATAYEETSGAAASPAHP